MKEPLTVSSGYGWLAQHIAASIVVVFFGWSFIGSCYRRGMDGWREYHAARKYATASAIEYQGDVPPKPSRYVTDLTGVIDAERASALNERLAAFERETSTQIVVFVARAMNSRNTIEEIANRAYNEWQIGSRGKDNGVLFLVFIEDREMRIEVGYGLEGVLTDALASRIIEDVAVPFFKREAYTEGVEASARAIMDVARGEGIKGTGQTNTERASMFGVRAKDFSISALGFILTCTGIAIGVFICAAILLALQKIFGNRPGFSGGGSSRSWSGSSSSSSSSYRSSSSSSSSSSFSGGGGRSGGGGASGSW